MLPRPRRLHQELHQDLGVRRQVLGHALGGVGDLGALAGGVEDAHPGFALVGRDLLRDLRPLRKELEDLGVYLVDALPEIGELCHVLPFVRRLTRAVAGG